MIDKYSLFCSPNSLSDSWYSFWNIWRSDWISGGMSLKFLFWSFCFLSSTSIYSTCKHIQTEKNSLTFTAPVKKRKSLFLLRKTVERIGGNFALNCLLFLSAKSEKLWPDGARVALQNFLYWIAVAQKATPCPSCYKVIFHCCQIYFKKIFK